MRSLRMRDEEPAPTGRSMSRTWSDYTSRSEWTPIAGPR
jgi:hypothetical protein